MPSIFLLILWVSVGLPIPNSQASEAIVPSLNCEYILNKIPYEMDNDFAIANQVALRIFSSPVKAVDQTNFSLIEIPELRKQHIEIRSEIVKLQLNWPSENISKWVEYFDEWVPGYLVKLNQRQVEFSQPIIQNKILSLYPTLSFQDKTRIIQGLLQSRNALIQAIYNDLKENNVPEYSQLAFLMNVIVLQALRPASLFSERFIVTREFESVAPEFARGTLKLPAIRFSFKSFKQNYMERIWSGFVGVFIPTQASLSVQNFNDRFGLPVYPLGMLGNDGADFADNQFMLPLDFVLHDVDHAADQMNRRFVQWIGFPFDSQKIVDKHIQYRTTMNHLGGKSLHLNIPQLEDYIQSKFFSLTHEQDGGLPLRSDELDADLKRWIESEFESPLSSDGEFIFDEDELKRIRAGLF